MREVSPPLVMSYLLLLLSFLVLASCSQPEILADRLVERMGVTYEVDSDEPFTGSAVEFHKNGQLLSKINYKDGKRDGLFETFFSENGQLKFRKNFRDGKKDGLAEIFHKNGRLKNRANFRDGKANGLFEEFREDGKLLWRGNYKAGVKID